MGRQTRNFRQSNSSIAGNASNKAYGKMNRMQGWDKIINVFKKGNNKVIK